jgi:hypothetical protein
VVDDLWTWLDAQLAKVPRRARIAEAIRYALKLWSGLRLFSCALQFGETPPCA